MKVIKIYEADNGDIFFKHDSFLKEVSKEEVEKAKKEAMKKYENGDFIKIKAKEGKLSIAYYDGECCLGDAGMHIRENFDICQDYIYINRKSDNSKSENLFKRLDEKRESGNFSYEELEDYMEKEILEFVKENFNDIEDELER